MEILTVGRKYPKEWFGSFTNMEKFASQAGDFHYIDTRFKFAILEGMRDKKIVYLDMEEPNRFFVSDPSFRRDEYEDYFWKILTMCPFTAIWLNKKQGNNRRIPVFYAVDPEYTPQKTEKKYDIIYSGGLYSNWLFEDVKTISKFKHKFVAYDGVLHYKFLHNCYPIRKLRAQIKKYFPLLKFLEPGAKYITESNIPHLEKWKIMAETKITLTHNMVPATPANIQNVYNVPGWEENEAFSLIPRKMNKFVSFFNHLIGKTYEVPQLKSRAFEAGLCRSLILCRRDNFNVIEEYFEPGKEFVYYEEGKLEEKIREILSDWESYEPIIENAYHKVMAEYTNKRFFEKYLKDLK